MMVVSVKRPMVFIVMMSIIICHKTHFARSLTTFGFQVSNTTAWIIVGHFNFLNFITLERPKRLYSSRFTCVLKDKPRATLFICHYDVYYFFWWTSIISVEDEVKNNQEIGCCGLCDNSLLKIGFSLRGCKMNTGHNSHICYDLKKRTKQVCELCIKY